MMQHPNNATRWIDQVFSAQAVRKQGIVRRSVLWVENEIGREEFVQEVIERGFQLLQIGNQFVIICSNKPVFKVV